MNRCSLWVLSGRLLDHTASPRAEYSTIERGERVVDSVGIRVVLGIEHTWVDCLPKGVVIVYDAVTGGMEVSIHTI